MVRLDRRERALSTRTAVWLLGPVLALTPLWPVPAGAQLEQVVAGPIVDVETVTTLLSDLDAPVLEPTGTEAAIFEPPPIDGCEALATILDQAAAAADDVQGVRYTFGREVVEQTVWNLGATGAEDMLDDLRARDLQACSRASVEDVAPDADFVLRSFGGLETAGRRAMEVKTRFGSAAQLTLPDGDEQDFVTFWSVQDGYASRVATQWSDVDVVDDRGRVRRQSEGALATFAWDVSAHLWRAGAARIATATLFQPADLAPIAAVTGEEFFVDRQPELSRAMLPTTEACELTPAQIAALERAVGVGTTMEAAVRLHVFSQDVRWFESERDARRFERVVHRGVVEGCVHLGEDELSSFSDAELEELDLVAGAVLETANLSSYVLVARSGAAVLDLRIQVAGVALDHALLADLTAAWVADVRARAMDA